MSHRVANHRQQGAAILTVTVVLLALTAIATLMVGRVSLLEQKAAGRDVRGKEVYSVAIGGLEYAVNWISHPDNAASLAWSGGNGCGKDAVAAPPLPANSALSADSYTNDIQYTRRNCQSADPQIIEVRSKAVAIQDSHVRKQVHKDVFLVRLKLFSGVGNIFSGPPLLVEDCILEGGSQGVTGNPSIFPATTPEGELVAIGTTSGNSDCLAHGHFDLQGGKKAALLPSASLWDSVFGSTISKADIKAQAESSLNNPQRIIFVDESYPTGNGWNGNNWHRSVGNDANPVLLFFDASQGCPKLNGAVNIVGVVYFEAADCGSHGWGNGTVKGTVAVSGNLTGLSANTELAAVDLYDQLGGGAATHDVFFSHRIVAVPGSWRDF